MTRVISSGGDILKAMAAATLLGRDTRGPMTPKGLPEQIVDAMNAIFRQASRLPLGPRQGASSARGNSSPAEIGAGPVEGFPPSGQAGQSDRPILG